MHQYWYTCIKTQIKINVKCHKPTSDVWSSLGSLEVHVDAAVILISEKIRPLKYGFKALQNNIIRVHERVE